MRCTTRKTCFGSRSSVYLTMTGTQCAGYFYYGAFPNGVYKDFELCLNSRYFFM